MTHAHLNGWLLRVNGKASNYQPNQIKPADQTYFQARARSHMPSCCSRSLGPTVSDFGSEASSGPHPKLRPRSLFWRPGLCCELRLLQSGRACGGLLATPWPWPREELAIKQNPNRLAPSEHPMKNPTTKIGSLKWVVHPIPKMGSQNGFDPLP